MAVIKYLPGKKSLKSAASERRIKIFPVYLKEFLVPSCVNEKPVSERIKNESVMRIKFREFGRKKIIIAVKESRRKELWRILNIFLSFALFLKEKIEFKIKNTR